MNIDHVNQIFTSYCNRILTCITCKWVSIQFKMHVNFQSQSSQYFLCDQIFCKQFHCNWKLNLVPKALTLISSNNLSDRFQKRIDYINISYLLPYIRFFSVSFNRTKAISAEFFTSESYFFLHWCYCHIKLIVAECFLHYMLCLNCFFSSLLLLYSIVGYGCFSDIFIYYDIIP